MTSLSFCFCVFYRLLMQGICGKLIAILMLLGLVKRLTNLDNKKAGI
ncbi:hypothetical protein PSPO_a0277 [Pseudoalteromonas spongiae UST010723-006]|nr:hypothetical protein PSPO_a0277 [Pseudoalteromonas spongiae UST010723-006]